MELCGLLWALLVREAPVAPSRPWAPAEDIKRVKEKTTQRQCTSVSAEYFYQQDAGQNFSMVYSE